MIEPVPDGGPPTVEVERDEAERRRVAGRVGQRRVPKEAEEALRQVVADVEHLDVHDPAQAREMQRRLKQGLRDHARIKREYRLGLRRPPSDDG